MTVPAGAIGFRLGAPTNGSWVSAEVDFTTTATGVILMPAHAGFFFVPISVNMLVTVAAGALTAGFLLKAGNNAARDNVIAQQVASPWTASQQTAVITEAGVPLRASPGVVYSAGGHPNATGPILDLAAPILLNVTTAATGTGGFALKAKIVLFGTLVAV